mmetsp:Transcript_34304/g.79324  ORF Transcript_34304/g.79324 Transcript_34304/m.79324 type:complete len:323 (-) Transcript_34304:573-1541(-)
MPARQRRPQPRPRGERHHLRRPERRGRRELARPAPQHRGGVLPAQPEDRGRRRRRDRGRGGPGAARRGRAPVRRPPLRGGGDHAAAAGPDGRADLSGKGAGGADAAAGEDPGGGGGRRGGGGRDAGRARGDVREHSQTGQDRFHPGADAADPAQGRFRAGGHRGEQGEQEGAGGEGDGEAEDRLLRPDGAVSPAREGCLFSQQRLSSDVSDAESAQDGDGGGGEKNGSRRRRREGEGGGRRERCGAERRKGAGGAQIHRHVPGAQSLFQGSAGHAPSHRQTRRETIAENTALQVSSCVWQYFGHSFLTNQFRFAPEPPSTSF